MFYFKIKVAVFYKTYSREDGCDVNPHPLLITRVLQVFTIYFYPVNSH